MRYFAYECWIRSRARVHCEECAYLSPARLQRVCEDDTGTHDRWHDLGDFPTRELAMAEAGRRFRSGHDYDVAFCGRCVPGHNPELGMTP